MSRNIIEEMNRVSIAAVYLLPLLKLNMDTFGLNNFLDCQVTPDGRFLIVKVRDLEFVEDPYHSSCYVTCFTYKSESYIAFVLGPKWRHAFEKFREGKYSQFTEETKKTIITYCGLNWKAPSSDGKIITDARLLALYKAPELRQLIEDQLDVLLDDSELMNPPGPQVFLEIPELLSILRHNISPSS